MIPSDFVKSAHGRGFHPISRALRVLGTTSALLTAGPAPSAVDLCDPLQSSECTLQDFGSCEFDISYGNTGEVRALGALRVEGQGTLINPQIGAQTDLAVSCAVEGRGSDTLTVRLHLKNEGPTPSPALTYFAVVNPDGSGFPSSPAGTPYDVPASSFPATAPPPEPDAFGFDDLDNLDATTPGNVDYEIFALGQLSDTNYCGSFCNLIGALQWNIGSLAPLETAVVTVAYSDAGQALSTRLLTSARADDFGDPDDPGTVLTLSGTVRIATPVPALPRWAHIALGLGLGVSAARWLRSTRRRPAQGPGESAS